MSRPTAVALIFILSALAAAASITSAHDALAWGLVAGFLAFAGLLLEMLGPDTPAEDAYLRNHKRK